MSEEARGPGLNEEQIRVLTKLANTLAWKSPDLNVLRDELMPEYSELAQILQDKFLQSDKRGKLILPDLAAFGNETVAVFSDYAGESSGDYHTYSFLICGWNARGHFLNKVKEIRSLANLGE